MTPKAAPWGSTRPAKRPTELSTAGADHRTAELDRLGHRGVAVGDGEADVPAAGAGGVRHHAGDRALAQVPQRVGRAVHLHRVGHPVEHPLVEADGGARRRAVRSSDHVKAPGSFTSWAPMCSMGCHADTGAPTESTNTAILPAVMTSIGGTTMVPPWASTRAVVASTSATRDVHRPVRRLVGVHLRADAGDVLAVEREHAVAAGLLDRPGGLERPAEHAAVERRRRVDVGTARGRPTTVFPARTP